MKLTRRSFIQNSTIAIASTGFSTVSRSQNSTNQINVIVILLDDSGWADFRPFGSPAYPTPNVDRLAREGCAYRNFYVPQAICSASRAAMMTGCYPGRTKVFGAHGPNAKGLDPKFSTLGEVLKHNGYTTAMFGKWHMGDQPDTRPAARGFDYSCGLMYSNDMWKYHPERPDFWGQYPLQFWENNEVTIEEVSKNDQKKLTTWYTEHSISFIRQQKKPFFLFLSHSMPHVPLFSSRKFDGKSGTGLYGDVMMEIDWSVGQVMNALKETGQSDNTLIILTSDNGPWVSYGNHSGKTPFREAKGTSFEGGVRSGCLAKLPNFIEAGSISDQSFCSIDLLPTICHLTNTPLPNSPIDGKNVWDIMIGRPNTKNPHEYYPFSTGSRFEGIISGDGRWKLHLPHNYRTLFLAGNDGQAGKYQQKEIELSLFDLINDPYETLNVVEKYPEVTTKLKTFADTHQNKFYS